MRVYLTKAISYSFSNLDHFLKNRKTFTSCYFIQMIEQSFLFIELCILFRCKRIKLKFRFSDIITWNKSYLKTIRILEMFSFAKRYKHLWAYYICIKYQHLIILFIEIQINLDFIVQTIDWELIQTENR